MSESVLTEQRDAVLLITLNRPSARNAIDNSLSEGLTDAVARLNGDDDLRVGVLTGAGGVFCSGMDLKAFAKRRRRHSRGSRSSRRPPSRSRSR